MTENMLEQRQYTAAKLSEQIVSEFLALADGLACRRGGFGFDYRVRSEGVEESKAWIQRHYRHRDRINAQANSAKGGAAAVEQETGKFVSEASFIVAALDLRFTGKIVGMNCYFDFALRDPHNGNER